MSYHPSEVKKCTTDHGCGKVLPLSEFRTRFKKDINGRRKLCYSARCEQCDAIYNKVKGKEYRERLKAEGKLITGGSYGVKQDLYHTGPLDKAERVFFCEVKPCAI
jgi:hypothetical protein